MAEMMMKCWMEGIWESPVVKKTNEMTTEQVISLARRAEVQKAWKVLMEATTDNKEFDVQRIIYNFQRIWCHEKAWTKEEYFWQIRIKRIETPIKINNVEIHTSQEHAWHGARDAQAVEMQTILRMYAEPKQTVPQRWQQMKSIHNTCQNNEETELTTHEFDVVS